MTVTIPKSQIVSLLSKVAPITGRSIIFKLMPILENVVLTFKPTGTTAFGTNLIVSALAEIPFKTEEETVICVHGKILHDTVKAMKDGDIMLESQDSILKVSQGRTIIKLPTIDVDEMPEMPKIEKGPKLIFKAEALAEAFDKTDFACNPNDETRLFTQGVIMSLDGNGNISFVATDGYRIASYQIQDSTLMFVETTCIIPFLTVQFIRKAVSGEVTVYPTKKYIQFECEGITIGSQLLESTLPDINKIIQEQACLDKVTVNRQQLIEAIRQVCIVLGQSESICIKGSKDDLTLISNQEESKTTIEMDYEGPDFEYKIIPNRFLEPLSHMKGESVLINIPSSNSAIKLIEGDYVNVIQPCER